jgi:L-fucose mutarotase
MLKGIRAELNGDILQALCSMGHGDVLVVADANFPSDAIARETRLGKLLTMENIPAPQAIDAILSVLPLDTPLQPSVGRMEIIGKPDEIPPIQHEVQAIIDRVEGKPAPMYPVERMAFYELAKKAYCVIATGELRFYGCFLLTKGVIPAEEVAR